MYHREVGFIITRPFLREEFPEFRLSLYLDISKRLFFNTARNFYNLEVGPHDYIRQEGCLIARTILLNWNVGVRNLKKADILATVQVTETKKTVNSDNPWLPKGWECLASLRTFFEFPSAHEKSDS